MNVDYKDGTSEQLRNQTAEQVQNMVKRATDPDGDVEHLEVWRQEGKYVSGPYRTNRKDRRAAAADARKNKR